MYRGRYQQGQEIPLSVLCLDAAGTPSAPDAAPHCDVFSASAKVVSGFLLPATDRAAQTGYFQRRLRLGSALPAGRYTVVYRYEVGSYEGQAQDDFDVAAGGDEQGAVIAAYWYERPHADFVVQQLDSGRVVKGRNPRL